MCSEVLTLCARMALTHVLEWHYVLRGIHRKRRNEQRSWRKLDTDHQRGQYYEHCSRSIVPRELKERQQFLPLLSFSRRDEPRRSTLLGGKRRTNSSNMGEPIRTRAYQNKKRKVGWKRRARCSTGSCGAGQKKGRRKSAHFSSAGKKSSLTMMKQNHKTRRTNRTGANRPHIAGRAYDTGHV